MLKVDKEKTRYYLAKIHILFRGNFRTQGESAGGGHFCYRHPVGLPVYVILCLLTKVQNLITVI